MNQMQYLNDASDGGGGKDGWSDGGKGIPLYTLLSVNYIPFQFTVVDL